MNRRDAVKSISFIMGATMIGGTAIISGCKREPVRKGLFSNQDIELLDEIGETIIPETDIPGAKATGIGAFMAMMVEDTYDDPEQEIFKDGLRLLHEEAITVYEKSFMDLSSSERHDLLSTLNESMMHFKAENDGDQNPYMYFRMMKELTLLGYFTSEVGVTQARRYAPIPGKFDACIDYSPGDKAWVHSI